MGKKALLCLVLMVFAILGGCGQGVGDGDDIVPVAVNVITVSRGEIAAGFSFSGEVVAGGEVSVVPKIAGRISRVAVATGDQVKKGDLLVQLEANELSLALKQAQAIVDIAKANLNSVQAGSGLAQLQASVRQAEINYNLTKDQLTTMEALYTQGGLALQQLNEVRARYEIALTQYNLAKNLLVAHERGEGQLEILQAQVRQAEVGLELAKLNVQSSVITAPVDGTVTLVNAEAGNFASPGMPVAVLMTGEKKQVMASVTEQTISSVVTGMKVDVEITALDVTIAGIVKEVAPAALSGTKFYRIIVELDDAPDVRPGMFARLKLVRESRQDAVLLPRAALMEQEGVYFIFTVSDNVAIRREVTVGLLDEVNTEITGGVSVGDIVVVAGQHFLRDGAPVQVEEGETS